MTNEEHDADVIAIALALKVLFMHIPAAAHQLRSMIPQVQDQALFQPVSDAQIARMKKMLLELLPPAQTLLR